MPNDTWFEVGSTREIADVKIPKVTGTATIENFVARNAKQSTPVAARDAPPYLAANDLVDRRGGGARCSSAICRPSARAWRISPTARWASSTGRCAPRSTRSPIGSTRGTPRSRTGAWSSCARQRSTGIHLGASAGSRTSSWRRSPTASATCTRPRSRKAATAAILRSGHLANRERLAGAFNINLTSERTKRALGLLEGVANGQTPAALLGYRFERGLRDARLGKYILLYRKRYPLRRGNDTADRAG